jgi:hypothetical protein
MQFPPEPPVDAADGPLPDAEGRPREHVRHPDYKPREFTIGARHPLTRLVFGLVIVVIALVVVGLVLHGILHFWDSFLQQVEEKKQSQILAPQPAKMWPNASSRAAPQRRS